MDTSEIADRLFGGKERQRQVLVEVHGPFSRRGHPGSQCLDGELESSLSALGRVIYGLFAFVSVAQEVH
jgi:hypothetical protein